MSAISKLMQKITLSNPAIGKTFYTKMKPGFFESKGLSGAIELYNTAIKTVPAYQEFLKGTGTNLQKISSKEAFLKLPIIDKDSYVKKYPLAKRCLNGDVTSFYAVSSSSGSTGIPTYWPRSNQSDAIIPKVLELLLTDLVDLPHKSTLVIVNLSMGLWSAGDMCTYGCRMLAANPKYRVTVAAPGLRINESLRLVKDLGPSYDNVLMIGYPPLIKDIIEAGENEGFDWKKHHTKLMMGGEGVTEDWRDYLLEKIGSKNLLDISNLFATSDAGIVGFETPLSIVLRRIIDKNEQLKSDIFGKNEVVSLVQYNPASKFIEEIDGEIVISSAGAVPLLRYNIHDRGRVMKYVETLELLKSHGIDLAAEMSSCGYDMKDAWHIPFFAVYGRSDGVHFYAVNIYRENIMLALRNDGIKGLVSGKYKMGVLTDGKQNQQLNIKVGLAKNISKSADNLKRISETLQAEMRKLNHEYNELCNYLKQKHGEEYLPKVELIEASDKDYFHYEIKNQYIL